MNLDKEVGASSSNLPANDIDVETALKLKGDAIGDTMYSEVFVLKTLMHFSRLEWSPQIEDDLCFLWDMTEEKDVCQYLFNVSYPSLACAAINKYSEENRFIEIVIGILANILCADCCSTIEETEIRTVLNVLSSDDPLILIQTVRFLHALIFKLEKIQFVTNEVLDALGFILLNSFNKDLLINTMKALASLTSDCKLEENLVRADYIKFATTAYGIVTRNDEGELQLESREQKLAVKYLIEIVCNVCIYIDTLKVSRLFQEVYERSDPNGKLFIDDFISEVIRLFNYYKNEENLIPLTDEFKFYIDAMSFIFRTLTINYYCSIFVNLCEMIVLLINSGSDDIEEIAEFFCYFISVQDPRDLVADLRRNINSMEDLKKVIDIIKKNKYHFEFDYKEHFKEMYSLLNF